MNPDHAAHDFFVGRYESLSYALTTSYVELDRWGKHAGSITPTDSAIHTITMMDGLQLQWLLHREATDMTDQLTGFLRRTTELDF